MAVTPIGGDVAALLALGGAGGASITLHLFQNAYTPTIADVPSNYVEATYTGYVAYNGSGWTAPATDVGNVSYIVSPALTFTQSGTGVNNTIYGWYATVTISAVTYVIAADLFPVARTMNAIGATCPLQVTLTQQGLAA